MTEASPRTFWDRLGERTNQIGFLARIEEPATIVRVWTAVLWASVALAWLGAASFFNFGEISAGWAMVALGASYALAWIVYAITGSARHAVVMLVVISAAVNTFVHIVLGGYANSGAMVMWAIAMTVLTALTLGRKATYVITAFFIIEAIAFAVVEPTLHASRTPPNAALSAQLFAIVLVGTLLVLTPLVGSLLNRLDYERQRGEGLLLNVLPRQVATELKQHGRVAARRFESVSVLFADIVGFTPLSARMEPEELVWQLNDVFSYFDGLTLDSGCEKIRTIGDAYMVAAGVPTPRSDHAHALATIAIAMREYASTTGMTFRIGINSGPVVAGVIGTDKFQYDVWGDTVNIASRMESHGEPGTIHISQSTYELLRDDFLCTPRGEIEVKGKGTLTTWYLDSRKPGGFWR